VDGERSGRKESLNGGEEDQLQSVTGATSAATPFLVSDILERQKAAAAAAAEHGDKEDDKELVAEDEEDVDYPEEAETGDQHGQGHGQPVVNGQTDHLHQQHHHQPHLTHHHQGIEGPYMTSPSPNGSALTVAAAATESTPSPSSAGAAAAASAAAAAAATNSSPFGFTAADYFSRTTASSSSSSMAAAHSAVSSSSYMSGFGAGGFGYGQTGAAGDLSGYHDVRGAGAAAAGWYTSPASEYCKCLLYSATPLIIIPVLTSLSV